MATNVKRKKKAEVMEDDGSMTLTGHLKELRNRLIICAVVFVAGVVVSLAYADRLIDDLGLDSFLIVYFITEIEDCFEIDIPETDFIELVTVKDLCERIQLEIKKHSTY